MYLLSICLSLSLSASLCLCLRLWQRAWCLDLWQCECLFPRMDPHLMLTHLHNNNPIWFTSDTVLDASNEAITPDKMLSLLVFQIKKHMESVFFFMAGDKHQSITNSSKPFFFCTSACVNTSYLFHLWDIYFSTACYRKGISWSLTINKTFKLSYL